MSGKEGDADAFFHVVHDAACILFVDDDPILREFAQVHLTTEQTQVVVAEDGVGALETMGARTPDIVLLDLEMPNMDGFEVLVRMRAEPRLAHLPVIVVTGREDIAAIDRAYQAGATAFVAKPINWRLLSYQIRYVHRSHCEEQRLAADEARAREALSAVTAAGARFLAQALGRHPELRAAGAPYLAALEDGAGRVVRDGVG